MMTMGVMGLVYVGAVFNWCKLNWFSLVMKVRGCYWVCVGLAIFLVLLNVSSLWVEISGSMGYLYVLMVATFCWGMSVVANVLEGGVGAYVSHFSVAGLMGIAGLGLPTLELVSLWLRPLTLGVRLATNVSSGHVLLSLSGAVTGVLSGWLFLSVVMVMILEVFVGVLQGFIFGSLVVMYTSG